MRAFQLLVLLSALLLAGCVAVGSAGNSLGLAPRNPLTGLQIVAAADANSGSATAIDIVWVFNDAGMAEMPKTAPQWFASKAALLAGRSPDLEVLHLEVPVGSAMQNVSLPARHRDAVAVLAYVNFILEAGQPVVKLTPYRCARIELNAASVSYRACPLE